MTYTADQIVGNRLEVENGPITVYLGSPGSDAVERWETGFVSPQVYSWVEHKGDIYWQVGELPPLRYVKHEGSKLEVFADSGGAKFLKEEPSTAAGFSNFFSGFNLENLQTVVKVFLAIIGFMIGWQIFSAFK